MQCQAITQVGTQCKRPAINNSQYCWQHTLMGQALQPDIMNQISLFSGNSITKFSNALPNTINLRKILGNWFAEIKVKTSIDDIKNNEIQLLWTLYQKRIDNAPARDLLKKAISQGLDPYIFKSKIFHYYDTLELPDDVWDFIEMDFDYEVTQDLKDFIQLNKMRTGDIVYLAQYGFYGAYIYDGKLLNALKYINGIRPNLPDSIDINNYPTTNYFNFLKTDHEEYYININFDTSDTKIQLSEKYELKELGINIFVYQTIGKYKNYKILTTNPNFEFKHTLELSPELQVFLDTIPLLLDIEYPEIYDKLLNDQSLRILYDDYREVDKSDEQDNGDYNDDYNTGYDYD